MIDMGETYGLDNLPDELVHSKYNEIPYHYVLTNLMNAFTKVLEQHPSKPMMALADLMEAYLVNFVEPIKIPEGKTATHGILMHNKRADEYQQELKDLDEEYNIKKVLKELRKDPQFVLFVYNLGKWRALMRLLGKTQYVPKAYKGQLIGRKKDDSKNMGQKKGTKR